MSNDIQKSIDETISLREAELVDERTLTNPHPGALAPADSNVIDNDPAKLVGKVFAEKYEILAPLGRGGMSIVYRARHLVLDKVFALKILQMHLSTDEVSLRRFKQEAHTASNLNHPGIVSVHDCGEDGNGMPYLVMDLVEGNSLSELIKKDGPLSAERFLSFMQQVTSALSHAHQNGIVHRDLKPSNIIIRSLDEKETASLLDFGIAKILSQSDEAQNLTQTGEIFGSPLYMSPEQCSGSAIDQRSDIYSMGCVMYEALSGNVPFMGDSVIETIHKHVNEMPPPLMAPQLDEDERRKMEVILLKCLAKQPQDRYQNVMELEAELRSLSMKSKRGILGKLGGAWDLASAKRRASKKNKLPLVATALLTVSLLSVASGLMLMLRFHEMDSAISSLQDCRQLLRRCNQLQQSIFDMQEAGAQYGRANFWKGVQPQEKQRLLKVYEKSMLTFKSRLERMDTDLERYPEFKSEFSEKWRPALFNLSVTFDRIARGWERRSVIQAETSYDMQSIINFRRMATQVTEGIKVIRGLNKRAEKLEEKLSGAVTDTTQWVVYLGIVSVLLSATAALSLIYYFAKGTPQKMRKLAAEAIRLRKKGKAADTGADVVEDIDNVLHELANALSEAEEREKFLLSKLNAKDRPAEKPPVNLEDSTRLFD